MSNQLSRMGEGRRAARASGSSSRRGPPARLSARAPPASGPCGRPAYTVAGPPSTKPTPVDHWSSSRRPPLEPLRARLHDPPSVSLRLDPAAERAVDGECGHSAELDRPAGPRAFGRDVPGHSGQNGRGVRTSSAAAFGESVSQRHAERRVELSSRASSGGRIMGSATAGSAQRHASAHHDPLHAPLLPL